MKSILISVSLSFMFIFAGSNIYAQSNYRRGKENTVKEEKKEETQKYKYNRPNNRPATKPIRPQHRPTPPSHRPPSHRPVPPVSHHPVRPHYPSHKPIYRPNYNNYGHTVRTIPYGAVRYRRAGIDYYYVGGRYYRSYRGAYIICRPPAGAILAASIINTVTKLVEISIRDSRGNIKNYYTNNDGVYYQKQGNEYKVIAPPVGAIVEELPYGTEEMILNGETYYKVDETLYQYIYDNNKGYYQVVGKMVK